MSSLIDFGGHSCGVPGTGYGIGNSGNPILLFPPTVRCGPEVRHCSLATGAPVRHSPDPSGRRRKPVGSNANNPSLFFFYVVPAPEGRLKGLPVAVRSVPPALNRPAGARTKKRGRAAGAFPFHGLAAVARVHAAPSGLAPNRASFCLFIPHSTFRVPRLNVPPPRRSRLGCLSIREKGKKGTGKKGTCYFFGGISGDRHFRPSAFRPPSLPG